MPSDDWRITVSVDNASRVPVSGARLTLQIWEGGLVHRLPPIPLQGPTFTFTVPRNTQSVVCELRHDSYAPLHMALVRALGESVWRWTNSTRRARTSGLDVDVAATLSRMRPVPVGYISDERLNERAAVHQPALKRFEEENKRRAAHKPKPLPPNRPSFVPLDFGQRTALVTEHHTAYRLQARRQPKIEAFHQAGPELFSDVPSALGWRRFATRSPGTVDPVREGRLYLVEYGEVGDAPSLSPRFAVGVWVPHVLHSPKVKKLDFVVWLHPEVTHNELRFPQVEFPFRDPYPYGLVARLVDNVALPFQPFMDVPITHLLDQHFLAYSLAAARKAAVLVVPVAPGGLDPDRGEPSSHFEPFTAPESLMRVLRELCLWIPQDFPRGTEAAVHGPAPEVGRVVVSAFSSSGPELGNLMRGGNLSHSRFPAPLWWSSSSTGGLDDEADFRSAWKEQWSIDHRGKEFLEYTEAAASWVRDRADRRLRIYKSTFTGGWHLPAPRRKGAWAQLVKDLRLRFGTHTSGGLRATSLRDTGLRVHAVSVPSEFVLGPKTGPEAGLEPQLRPTGAHEMMPRVFFGHAVASSGLTDIG